MSKEQKLLEGEEKSWENMRIDDLEISPDNVAKPVTGGLSHEHDIIELVDVVREGDLRLDTGGDDLSLLFDQEEETEKKKDFLGRENDDLTDFSIPPDETLEEEPESELSEPDALYDRFESPDFDFESPENFEEPAEEDPVAIEEKLGEIPEEDMNLVMAGLADEMEDETSQPDATDEQSPRISQERLEAVVSRAVTEVVERVVRQTVAEVAERVIREAIESLRHSLDTTSE
jgi:hypothetical protein